jgi:hypothetical protein
MMAQNPNLRAVKPLSKYMDLKVRMIGRQRLALEYEVSGNNQVNVSLPFTPDAPENLEIYLDDVRVVGGYTINKSVVTFTAPKNGRLFFISDTQLVDPGLKWLEIPTQNLIQSDDFSVTAYGTDRTEQHQVATFTKPICISQGGLGFCRPSADNSKLLFSSLYGRFGRDTITYALMTDAGQLSDYRCIDIRIRDPNYIPPIRIQAISATAKPLRVNGTVVNIETPGEWQMYGEAMTGTIELPNKTTLEEMHEYHFVIQGRDEEGKWFELQEYFDVGEYEIVLEHSDDFVITQQGSTTEWGFENGERLSVMCKQTATSPLNISLRVDSKSIFDVSIVGRGPEVLAVMDVPREITDTEFTYNKDPDGTNADVIWDVDSEEFGPYGITTTTSFANDLFEDHRVELDFKGTVTFTEPLYDPVAAAFTQAEFDVSRVISGRFITAEDPLENNVIAPNSSIVLLPKTMLWRNADIWSDMYVYEPLTFTYTNKWSIP